MTTATPQWNRVLSAEEARCLWANYPETVKANVDNGLSLDAYTASFGWNWSANKSGVFKSVHCKVDGKYNRHLTDIEAKCYWKNHPQKADNFKKNGHELDTATANYAWNFNANFT